MEKLIITQKAILSLAYVGSFLPANPLRSSVNFANANYFRVAHYQRENTFTRLLPFTVIGLLHQVIFRYIFEFW